MIGTRARALSIAVTLATATALVGWGGPAHAATPGTPGSSDEVLYQAGVEGYACYRIPAVVKATNGDLLAFAEGRVDSCADLGDIDLVLKRSSDGGRTW